MMMPKSKGLFENFKYSCLFLVSNKPIGSSQKGKMNKENGTEGVVLMTIDKKSILLEDNYLPQSVVPLLPFLIKTAKKQINRYSFTFSNRLTSCTTYYAYNEREDYNPIH